MKRERIFDPIELDRRYKKVVEMMTTDTYSMPSKKYKKDGYCSLCYRDIPANETCVRFKFGKMPSPKCFYLFCAECRKEIMRTYAETIQVNYLDDYKKIFEDFKKRLRGVNVRRY